MISISRAGQVGLILVLHFLAWTDWGGLFAGGPRLVSAPRWAPPITYRLDPGPLRAGGVLTHQQGADLVEESFGRWTGVATADFEVVNQGNLPVDVDASNFNAVVNNPANGNPIVFDADGTIIQSMMGMGSGGTVLGFATGIDSDSDGFQDFGLAVLNGTVASLAPGSSFRVTVVHELGHLVGLDHTQAGAESFSACSNFNPDACLLVPVMFPLIRGGVTVALNSTPLTDDRAWISWLYPAAEFETVTGRIEGRVRRRQGVPFQGVNVVAARVESSPTGGPAPDPQDRVSIVTDALGGLEGEFLLPGLPPGDYNVRIEALQAGFTQGSGVGPFDLRFTDFASPDYYNGAGETGMEGGAVPSDERSVLTVRAGRSVAGIEFVSDDNSDALPGSDLTSLGDDESRTIFLPPGFTFPFFGRTYRAFYLNSDGNLSFEGGQEATTRREADFVNGPPRIAPLYTDLDPSEAGRVRTAMEDGGFTVTWEDVPEFSGTGGRPGNTFSVTLFPNGNIRFRYGAIRIQPDGLTQAIVGITPGRTAGASTDLSAMPSPVGFLGAPLYQVFLGTSFDLSNQELLFEASTNRFFLNFPLVQSDGDSFTGVAVSNDSDVSAQLVVEALSDNGTRPDFPENPGHAELDPGTQLARLSTEFFGLNFTQEQSGWMRISSNAQQLSSFFQIGNGLAGPTTRLDGSVAIPNPANLLYFTRIFDGPSTFNTLSGPRDATTLLALANPGGTEVTATLILFNSMGQSRSQVMRTLPPGGCLRETARSLFGPDPIGDGFVRVEATAGGVVGFALIQVGDSLMGLNPSLGNLQTVSYSAQLAHGNSNGTQIFTSLKLVNTSAEPRAVTLTAINQAGAVINVFGPFTLQPDNTFQRDLGTVFGLGPAIGPATAGSLRVEATGAGVIGDVVFGDPDQARYAAALPLQTSLLRRAVFSQVANRSTGEAASSTFTGLAFHNPNAQAAQITIRVFRETGELSGETTIGLAAGGRISEVLSVLAPETAGQERGFIEVLSDRPLVMQQLFGNLTLDFLSAVPPSLASP